jgi:hypothetical protein
VPRLLYIAFLVFSLIMTFRWADESLPRYLPKSWAQTHELDALQDWLGARLLIRHQSPYTPEGLKKIHAKYFGHPPTTLFWFVPLTQFDKDLAAELTGIALWFMLMIHIYICARELKFPAPVLLTALIFSWALTTEGMVLHWHLVQLSEPIALLLVICWFYLRRDRQVPAGIALGIAATLKLFPGVVILLTVLARRWRAFFTASALYALVAAIMTARLGIASWKLFLDQQTPIAHTFMGSIRNASLQGIVLRVFTPICETKAYPATRTSVIAGIIGLVLLLIAAVLSFRALKREASHNAHPIDLPFALFTVLAVFVNPWVWEHYWVLLIQPAFVLANALYHPLRVSFRDWLDERASSRHLAFRAFNFALGAAGIWATVLLIDTQSIRADHVQTLWESTKDPWVHRQLHLYEVFASAPWVVMGLLCFYGVYLMAPYVSKRRRNAAATASASEPTPHAVGGL